MSFSRRNWVGQAQHKATMLKVAVVTGSCFASSWPMKVVKGDTIWKDLESGFVLTMIPSNLAIPEIFRSVSSFC